MSRQWYIDLISKYAVVDVINLMVYLQTLK